jgi:DNA-directed RNA polymerase subunit M/transcription elongation factor TFIIS
VLPARGTLHLSRWQGRTAIRAGLRLPVMAGKHRTITVDGEELISLPALAALLGRSPMTVRRWIRKGRLAPAEVKIPKPGLLRGGSENYFTRQQVQNAISVLAKDQGRTSPTVNDQSVYHRPVRAWDESREADPRRIRQWPAIEDPASESKPEPEPLTSERCPHCGGKDILWQSSQIRGAHPALNQFAFCERCQRQVTPEPTFDPPPPERAWGDNYFVARGPAMAGRRRRPPPLTSVQAAVRAPKPAPTRRLNVLPPLD